jgi:shikimate kinase
VTPRLVLIGAPAAGKTRLGKRIARLMELPFLDTDKMVVAKHGPIPEIFAEHGEPQFRQWEREAVIEALSTSGVVAFGGGAILNEDTQNDLKGMTVVLVSITPEEAEKRIQDSSRPLLAGGLDAWRALVDKRQPIYDRVSTFEVDTSRRPLDHIAEEVVAQLQESA